MSLPRKYPITKLGHYLLVLIAIALLAACTPDQNEAFIQGDWYYNDLHIQEVVGESYSETYWTFGRGTYETNTCCFVKFQQFGRYDIVESEGDTMILELFNIDGRFNSERVQIGVHLDREADTIDITGTGPFTRLIP